MDRHNMDRRQRQRVDAFVDFLAFQWWKVCLHAFAAIVIPVMVAALELEQLKLRFRWFLMLDPFWDRIHEFLSYQKGFGEGFEMGLLVGILVGVAISLGALLGGALALYHFFKYKE